jgi:hypothetical protein
MVELGRRLMGLGKGVTVGNDKIPGLFFADDIVLMAEKEEELVQLLVQLVKFTEDRALTVNWEKSKMVAIGKGSRKRTERGALKISEQEMEVVQQYKYLGTYITSAKGGGQKVLVEGLSRKLGATKHLAGSSKDQTWAARALWVQAVKPSILYGVETQVLTKATIKKIKQAQNGIARWALGVSMRASELGLRGLLGLTTIEGELMKNKLIWWRRIEKMQGDRWPKKLLQEMKTEAYESSWLKEVKEALVMFKLTEEEVLNAKEGEKLINRAWKDWENTKWTSEKEESTALKCLPKKNLLKWDKQLDRTGWKKWVTKLMIGDYKWRGQEEECRLCGLQIESITLHVLLECEDEEVASIVAPLQNWRGEQQQIIKRGPREEKIQWIKSILRESRGHRIRRVARAMKKWEMKSGVGEQG